jgi:hypothetical protein
MKQYVEEAGDIVSEVARTAHSILSSKVSSLEAGDIVGLTGLILQVANDLKDADLSDQLDEATAKLHSMLDPPEDHGDMNNWEDN